MQVPPSLRPVVLLCAACPALAQDGQAEGAAGGGAAEKRVVESVRAGDLRGARRLLADMIVDQNVIAARRFLAERRALEALPLLDEALELHPRDAELQHLRGSAAYQAAGEPGVGNPGFFYDDALSCFREALALGYGVAGWFDASRAARRVPKPDEALELVVEGARRLAQMEDPPRLEPLLERTWAEAAFDVFRQRVADGADHEAAFAETELRLGNLLGRTPEDPWPREQLANLYEWVGDQPRALEQIRLALEVAPTAQPLHDRLQALAPATIGADALVTEYEAFTARHPGSGCAWRNRGVAEFYAALAGLEAGAGDVARFRAAEASLRRARETDPALASDCLGFEVVVRDAVGWVHYNREEFSAAKEAFLSMEDLFEGGLRWSLGDRLPSGTIGLDFVVQRLIGRPEDLASLDAMVEAAAITDFLHAYAPEDGNLANNAGFVNRDTATLFERRARQHRAEAQATQDPDQRAALERAAEQDLQRAEEGMRKSLAAYQVAAEVLSDNVRVINDTGLVIAYYLRNDPDRAEQYLLRAIELGARQLAEDDALPEGDSRKLGDARFALNEAWGDAHQNMGVLELTLRKRPAEALEWFRKSLAIGPPSREAIRPLATLCERLVAGEDVDWERALDRMVWLHNPRR